MQEIKGWQNGDPQSDWGNNVTHTTFLLQPPFHTHHTHTESELDALSGTNATTFLLRPKNGRSLRSPVLNPDFIVQSPSAFYGRVFWAIGPLGDGVNFYHVLWP